MKCVHVNKFQDSPHPTCERKIFILVEIIILCQYSKGRFFRLRNRNGSHFRDVNLFLEQVLLLPWYSRELRLGSKISGNVFVVLLRIPAGSHRRARYCNASWVSHCCRPKLKLNVEFKYLLKRLKIAIDKGKENT